MSSQRVITYIDGYNLYHGLLAAGLRSSRLLVAFPAKRHSSELRRVADAAFTISDRKIRASRLPPTIQTATGVTLSAPPGWLPSE